MKRGRLGQAQPHPQHPVLSLFLQPGAAQSLVQAGLCCPGLALCVPGALHSGKWQMQI